MFKPPTTEDLNHALCQCHAISRHKALRELKSFPLLTASPDLNEEIILFEILSLPTTSSYTFFSFVLNALNDLNSTVGIILETTPSKLHFYIGLKNHLSSAADLLEQGLLSTFPNIQFKRLNASISQKRLTHLFNSKNVTHISSAFIVPNQVSNPPLLKQLYELIKNDSLTIFFLASPTCLDTLSCEIEVLACLYNTLSQFTNQTHNRVRAVARNKSCTVTNNNTASNGSSLTKTNGCSSSRNAASYTNITPSSSFPIPNNRAINISVTLNEATGCSTSSNNSQANGENKNCSHSHSASHLNATNLTSNKAITFVKQNKSAIDCLASLSTGLTRLNSLLISPVFCFSAYFLASHCSTSLRAAYTYAGLGINPSAFTQNQIINSWCCEDEAFCVLLDELKAFNTPCFCLPEKEIAACLPINATELVNTFYFPFT